MWGDGARVLNSLCTIAVLNLWCAIPVIIMAQLVVIRQPISTRMERWVMAEELRVHYSSNFLGSLSPNWAATQCSDGNVA